MPGCRSRGQAQALVADGCRCQRGIGQRQPGGAADLADEQRAALSLDVVDACGRLAKRRAQGSLEAGRNVGQRQVAARRLVADRRHRGAIRDREAPDLAFGDRAGGRGGDVVGLGRRASRAHANGEVCGRRAGLAVAGFHGQHRSAHAHVVGQGGG